MINRTETSTAWQKIVLILFLLIFVGGLTLFGASYLPTSPDFDQTFYPAIRYTLAGVNPYVAEYLESDQGASPDFFSPPWLLLILLPFGLFPLEQARALWMIFLVVVTIAAIGLMRPWGLRGLWPLALAALPWSLIGILFGQVTALVLLGTVICVFELEKEKIGRQTILILLVGFLLIGLKPQLGLLIALPMILSMVWQRDKRLLPLIIIGLIIGATTLLITPPVFLQEANNVQQIASHWQSTLERELILWNQPLWIAHLVRIFVVGTMAWWVWRSRSLDPDWWSAWLAAVLLITPYTRAYDGVLLLPLLGLMLSLRLWRQIATFLLIMFLYIQLPNGELGSVVAPLIAWLLFVPWRSLLSSRDILPRINQH